ncbi:hypothetical protein VPNG_05625 [Cytospora leucostoma]|uniref:Copper homeostasis protein cutC homolog n=1 Tax=Cytospora leucostoma TaxID=1230097 RepID=A0A423X7C2_9PEZI|nr:hypothetical protein VPNG_05625 [Cytospora leucostoma]
MTGLEVPIFSPTSARIALSRGATRLEVNRAGSYPHGGLTPAESEVGPLSDSPAPLRIMIRPRGAPRPGGEPADFVYSDTEIAEMREAVLRFRGGGHLRPERGDGFVFGVLREVQPAGAGEHGRALVAVDVDRNRELVRLARPLACVFHRAFDDVLGSSKSRVSGGDAGPSVVAIEDALQAVADCGFDGILTSGGPGSAADNIETLSHVLRLAGRPGGAGLEIIVGGGVRSSNVGLLRGGLLGASASSGSARVWLHSSCLTARSGDDVDEEEVDKIVSGLSGPSV